MLLMFFEFREGEYLWLIIFLENYVFRVLMGVKFVCDFIFY